MYLLVLTVLPFLFFIGGYIAFAYWFPYQVFICPMIIGLPIGDALESVAPYRVSLRIVDYRTDNSVPPLTILHQSPYPGTALKEGQAINVVLNKHNVDPKMPHCYGLFQTEIEDYIRNKGLFVYIPSCSDKPETIIAQSCLPDEWCTQKPILYVAKVVETPVLFPSFKGKRVEDVVDFLNHYGISSVVHHKQDRLLKNHDCAYCYVSDQQPYPGYGIKSLKDMPSVHVYVD